MDVFAYGLLTEPERVASVVDAFVFVGPALLEGCHPVAGRHPTLAPGGRTAGRLLRTDDIDALDGYDGIDGEPYVRVSVSRTDGGAAAVYVGDPDALDAAGSVTWPGTGPFAERVRRYVDDHGVVLRPQHS
jgi:hypothetical protein